MTVHRFAELPVVRWKNGLGITREVAMGPPDATSDDFAWRVSLADVDTASPFSLFPGIDRTIVLLEGPGFTMTLDGERRHALTRTLEPFAFAGESRVEVELAGGATRDFNLMVRRGRAQGAVSVLKASSPVTLPPDGVVAYVADGAAHVDGVTLARGDSWTGTGRLEPTPACTLVIVTISDP